MTSPRVLLPGFEYRRVDVEGVTISCAVRGSGPPVLMLHGIWQPYAPDVRGTALPTGHFVPEEAPGLVADVLRDFLD